MGNCLDLCKHSSRSCIAGSTTKNVKLGRVTKPDGKILEFSTPIHVKDIFTNDAAYDVGVSKKVTQPLSLDHELKAGRSYHLLPSPNSTSLGNVKKAGEIKRIKLIITKQQLQQFVSNKISVEDILSQVQTVGVNFPSNRKTKLNSIPEEND